MTAARDRWRLPFDEHVRAVARTLEHTFVAYRSYTLLNERDSGDIFERVVGVPARDACQHALCERRALQRFALLARRPADDRLVVALVADVRDEKSPHSCTRRSLDASVAAALRVTEPHRGGEQRVHIVAVLWHAASPKHCAEPAATTQKALRRHEDVATVEFFTATELAIDAVAHTLQPRTIAVARPHSRAEAEWIAREYASLPRVPATDAVWRRFGAPRGTVLAYERTDSREGSSIVYRVGAWSERDADATETRRRECARLAACVKT